MKHQTKPSHRKNPKMSVRRIAKALKEPATKRTSIKVSNDGSQPSHVARMPIETMADQCAVVHVAQVSAPKQTVGLEETHDATHEISHTVSGSLQPGHVLVFGFGAIAIEGFEFVRRRIERSLDNINAFLQCRTPQDVVAAQGNWVRGHLQDANREIHRVAEILRELPTKNLAHSL
jgi:hypothetical protein